MITPPPGSSSAFILGPWFEQLRQATIAHVAQSEMTWHGVLESLRTNTPEVLAHRAWAMSHILLGKRCLFGPEMYSVAPNRELRTAWEWLSGWWIEGQRDLERRAS
jgi:hypothetical protein